MRVAFDAQLTVGSATGIGTYQRDLAIALRAAGVDVRTLDAPWLDPWRFDRRVAWDQVLLPSLAARSGATLLHATAGTLPVVRSMPTVVTVHDVAWLRVQGHTRAYARAYFGDLMRRLYHSAEAIVCDSAFTRDEFSALVGKRDATVVHLGVAAHWGGIVRAPDETPYALAVGTVEERKNLLVAVEALAEVPDLRLVAVGPPTPYLDRVRERAVALGVDGRFTYRGYVTPADLASLYARAAVAVVPSRYEGFGYGVAEALCAGVPVLAANAASLPEVAAGDAPLIDPGDATAWAGALAAVLADRAAAESRAAAARPRAVARFDWARVARETLAVYERVQRA